jgi:choline dehydrogenase-like flavoprotein
MLVDVHQVTGGAPVGRVVVIGAGAAGLYAASQLTSRGRHVVVIEAGDAHLGNFAAESYTSVGRTHTGIKLGRSRSLGGTTNLWGGQLVEFQPIDFAGRAWLPGSQWPVGYDEIAPYYKPTYEQLGVPLELTDDDAVWRGVGCAKPDLGPEFEVFFTRWMGTPNFAELFARQIQSDEKLSVLTGFTAVGFRGSEDRVTAVRVADAQGQSHWIEAETIILAAGTIENARLLLHTARDSAWQAPWSGNQNIGLCFQDHLGGKIAAFEPADKRAFFRMFSNVVYAGHKFQPKIRMRNEVQERQQLYNTQVFFAFESEISEHMVYLKQFLRAALYHRKLTGAGDVLRNGLGMARYLVPLMWKYVWEHRVFVPSTAKILMHVQAEHAPLEESRIALDPGTTDEYGLPCVVLDWRLGGDELASLREFAMHMRTALAAAGIGALTIDDDLLALDTKFLAKLGDTYHQAGGTKMGASAQNGVVDRNLRVFGTENVYVAGASVFPTTSNANTTFTALAFTTRLVDHLTGVESTATGAFSLASEQRS